MKIKIESLLDYNLKKLNDSAIKWGKKQFKQTETKFQKNFKKYFDSMNKSYEKMATVLDENMVNLIDRYQPTYLNYKDCNDNSCNIKTDNIENLLTVTPYAYITGFGGIGKSTILKYFLLSSLNNKSYRKKIPVYIELRKYNLEDDNKKRRHFLKFIYEEMKVKGFNIEFQYFEFMAKNGRFIFLLDAVDEISSEDSNQALIEISELITKYEKNNYVITSRKMLESDYINSAIPNIKSFKVKGLSKSQAISLISKIKVIDTEKKEHFNKLLSESLYDSFDNIASNPILLLLMYKTYNKTTEFPKIKASFLLEVYNILYDQHDAMKDGVYKRKFKTDFSKFDLLKLFSKFCYKTYYGKKRNKAVFYQG